MRTQTPCADWFLVPRTTIRETAVMLGAIYAQPWRELRAHLKAARTPIEGIIAFAQSRRDLCTFCGSDPRATDSRYCSDACSESDAEQQWIA